MKVLVACEYSGAVRDEFIRLGHDAISCDLLPTDKPGPHYQGDVFDIIDQGYDLMIAHPPCTYLAVSGARWFGDPERIQLQKEALEFVRKLMLCNIPKICIENPVSVISSKIRKPDQIIHPWQYGDEAEKTTCLWLKNLPILKPTKIVSKGEFVDFGNGKKMSKWIADAYGKPKAERQKIRSKTFPGIAKAMADQWGNEKTDTYQIVLDF